MNRLQIWRRIIFGTLLLIYFGLYMCRSNLTVVTPILKDDEGLSKEQIGFLISIGTIGYVVGKAVYGPLCDVVGGGKVMQIAMMGSVAVTFLFAISPASMFALLVILWTLNRFVQAGGWPAVMKIVSHWFECEMHGRVIGGVSLSYLFGDAIARFILGALLEAGIGWRFVYTVAASTLLFIFVLTFYPLSKKDPTSIGEKGVASSSLTIYGHEGNDTKPSNVFRELILPLLKSLPFYLLLVMSIGLTFIRETLRDWVVLYLQEQAQLSPSMATFSSTVFPISGGLASITYGCILDSRCAKSRRGLVLCCSLIVLILALVALTLVNSYGSEVSLVISLILLAIVGFALTGPYSLSSVFSLQLGGKKGSATVSSLNDGMGYLGSAFSGIATGYLASHFGWSAVFVLLTVAAGVTTLATAAYYWVVEYRHGGTVSHKLLLNEEEDSNLDDSEYNDIPLDSI